MENKNSVNNKPEPNYWRSFAELYNDPGFIEASNNEFKKGVTDDFDPNQLSGFSRRKFLALIGASAALAAAGCSDYRDKGEIIPYNVKPEEIIPGKPNYYASTCTACNNACGILIKTREGRPIKVDGNPDHPVNKGKICAKGQASILNLYDPERLRSPMKRTGEGVFKTVNWRDADFDIINILSKAAGKEIAVITHQIVSPTSKKVLDDFKNRFPSVKYYSYELFNDSQRPSAPLIKWDEAKIILSLEADFLGSEGNKIETVQLFSKGRDVGNIKNFNRLYAAEGNMTATGAFADYRIKVRPDAQYEFVQALINEISGGTGSIKSFADKHSISKKTLMYLVDDLKKNRSSALVYAGRTLPGSVHTLVNQLNNLLGNSNLFRSDVRDTSFIPLSAKEEWETLVNNINNNGVEAVIHLDTNPVYHFPLDLSYKQALKKVTAVITLTEMENETSYVSDYVIPVNHAFESWGDAQPRSNVYSLQQPVIYPIANTRQKEVVLLTWISGNSDNYNNELYLNYLKNRWQTEVYPSQNSKLDFQQFWLASLHDGVITSQQTASAQTPDTTDFNYTPIQYDGSKITVAFKESAVLGDGRYANNGWLQELPHPVSKVTWDNYASISMSTAKKLNVKENDIIEITVQDRKQRFPVLIQPGAVDNNITIELGYGREKGGTIGTGIGFNGNILLSKNGGLSPWLYYADKVEKTGDTYDLATAQEHHAYSTDHTKDESKQRNIIKTGTVKEYTKNKNFMKEDPHELTTLYGQHLPAMYSGLKWGMSIDMNKCLGCGECIIACNAENNVPVVGKDQVEKGREMHWIRVDRYYSGNPEEPEVSQQVMLCQHCDHAPCENVCPVVATTHSEDGLNQMAYNRCVGTRYCSNNCPYKVRRFNYFNFRDHFKDAYQESSIFNLVYNPEVTVRSRGVMEKCTFCIQRIMDARSDAIKENRQLNGNDVTVACQDACASHAIEFGDINNTGSRVHKYRNHELGYYVLEDLNTRPNVTYIAKLRNTHSEDI